MCGEKTPGNSYGSDFFFFFFLLFFFFFPSTVRLCLYLRDGIIIIIFIVAISDSLGGLDLS